MQKIYQRIAEQPGLGVTNVNAGDVPNCDPRAGRKRTTCRCIRQVAIGADGPLNGSRSVDIG
jgi:hypothetical protein